MNLSEPGLISLLTNRRTKKEGFSQLVDKYQGPLYRAIRRIVISHEDTRDILQNTFLRAWKSLDKFRGEAKIYSWVYRIAINESYRFLEKKKRLLNGKVDLEDVLVKELESEQWIEGNEAQIKLQKAILTLPRKQRIVFNMRYFGEMKYSEISEILDISEASLKVSYHHSKKKIEALLKFDAL